MQPSRLSFCLKLVSKALIINKCENATTFFGLYNYNVYFCLILQLT